VTTDREAQAMTDTADPVAALLREHSLCPCGCGMCSLCATGPYPEHMATLVEARVRAQIAADIEADRVYDVPSRAHFARIARGDA
jgi:hypothetical protein